MDHELATFGIEVDVALSRPPRVDATTYHVISTELGEVDAHYQAIATATVTRSRKDTARDRRTRRDVPAPSAHVIMAVGCRTVWVEI